MSRKRHPILTAAFLTGAAVMTTAAVNRLIFHLTGERHPLSCDGGEFHSWKQGDFFYKKKEGGNGRPILILHELFPDKSSDQCEALACQLSEKRCVYTMDLLGCGRSAKPAVTYTNFLYVLQVTECVEKIIGQPVHLVAMGRSADIAIAAAHYRPEYYSQITLLDPPAERDEKKLPDEKSRLAKRLIELPVFGTLIYNMAFGKNAAAHMGGSSARYLYASIAGHYTDYDVAWMLQSMKTPIHIIETQIKEAGEIPETNE